MILDLQNITKYYEIPDTEIKQMVLNDISLSVDTGDSLAIVGPSGSGKSTLLNIMGTLDKPVSGNVKFKGVNINSLHDTELASLRNKNIGFIFQRHLLLPQLTVMDNVLLPTIPLNDKKYTLEAMERAMELLNRVGLTNKTNQVPGKLSVGECQRVAVVRALINKPEIILADEPTGALDKDSAENLGELLKSLNSDFQVAIVLVTHSLELASKMSKKLSLFQGKLHE